MTYTNEQIIKNRELWEEALESGEYAHGIGRLCQQHNGEPKQYCCLGVACHLFLGEPLEQHESFNIIHYSWKDNDTRCPPQEVVKALGLYNEFGGNGYTTDDSLARANDMSSDGFTSVIEKIKSGDYYKPLT